MKKDFKPKYQNDDWSCGAVCAYMLLANNGRHPDWSKLLTTLETNPAKGTSQIKLVKAFRKFNFKTKVVSFLSKPFTAKDLEPMNHGWYGVACVDNNNHWIVLRYLGNNTVHIVDPELKNWKYHHLTTFKKRIKSGSIIFVKGIDED